MDMIKIVMTDLLNVSPVNMAFSKILSAPQYIIFWTRYNLSQYYSTYKTFWKNMMTFWKNLLPFVFFC